MCCQLTKFTCANPEGGTAPPPPPPLPPLKNHKDIGVHSNTGLDPLKITKLPSQHSMLGHYRRASETQMAFRWRVDDDPLIVVFGSSHKLKKKQARKIIQKNVKLLDTLSQNFLELYMGYHCTRMKQEGHSGPKSLTCTMCTSQTFSIYQILRL